MPDSYLSSRGLATTEARVYFAFTKAFSECCSWERLGINKRGVCFFHPYLMTSLLS